MLVRLWQFSNALYPIEVTGNSSGDCDVSRWVLGTSIVPLANVGQLVTEYSVPSSFKVKVRPTLEASIDSFMSKPAYVVPFPAFW